MLPEKSTSVFVMVVFLEADPFPRKPLGNLLMLEEPAALGQLYTQEQAEQGREDPRQNGTFLTLTA